jgi:hypothetical protein
MGYDEPDEKLQVSVERAPERARERDLQRILPQNFHIVTGPRALSVWLKDRMQFVWFMAAQRREFRP